MSGAAGAKLHEAEVVLSALDAASEYAAVKREHSLEIDDSEHQMVDFANGDRALLVVPGFHRAREWGGHPKSER